MFSAYIDLLLFDGRNSLEIVQEVLREKGMPEGSSVGYFSKEKHSYQQHSE